MGWEKVGTEERSHLEMQGETIHVIAGGWEGNLKTARRCFAKTLGDA
jgi:Mn-containing catalase